MPVVYYVETEPRVWLVPLLYTGTITSECIFKHHIVVSPHIHFALSFSVYHMEDAKYGQLCRARKTTGK